MSWRFAPASLRLPLAVLSLEFLLFALARLFFLIVHWDSVRSLDAGEFSFALLHGLRFDASMIFLLWGPPILTLLLPLRPFQTRAWRGVVFGLIGLGLLAQALLFLGDTVYFGYVQRHVGQEAVAMFTDLRLLAAMALEDYLPHLLAFFVFGCGFLWLFSRVCWKWLHDLHPGRGSWGYALLFLMIGTVAVRGGVTNRKPLNPANAMVGENPYPSSWVALNAPFNVYHTVRKAGVGGRVRFMPHAEAAELVQHELGITAEVNDTPASLAASKRFPLFRTPVGTAPAGAKNCVVIMLESWDAWFVDAWRESQGLEPLGLTPNFDALARDGRLYTDFYASGQRSVHGVAAILASVPTLPTLPYIGTGGLEQNRLGLVSQLAEDSDYHTFFFRSARRESYRLDRVAQVGGFDLYRGAEDLSERYRGVERHKYGVWDEVLFRDAALHMAQCEQPFFGFLFPSSTHHPFTVPDDNWELSEGSSKEARFSNALRYSDDTLGAFFDSIRDEPWFDETLFIITADHVSGVRGGDLPMPERFRVPCLLLGPGIEAAVDPRTGSQLDILPTIVEELGWDAAYSGLGRSLLDEREPRNHGAMMVIGDDAVMRKEGPSWLVRNVKRRLISQGGEELDALDLRLQANWQLMLRLLADNRVFPGPESPDN